MCHDRRSGAEGNASAFDHRRNARRGDQLPHATQVKGAGGAQLNKGFRQSQRGSNCFPRRDDRRGIIDAGKAQSDPSLCCWVK